MKLTLHHINLCSTDVPAMDEFYRSVLDMAPEPSLQASRDTSQGYAGASPSSPTALALAIDVPYLQCRDFD